MLLAYRRHCRDRSTDESRSVTTPQANAPIGALDVQRARNLDPSDQPAKQIPGTICTHWESESLFVAPRLFRYFGAHRARVSTNNSNETNAGPMRPDPPLAWLLAGSGNQETHFGRNPPPVKQEVG